MTARRPWTSEKMFSVQVTHARSPVALARTSERLNRISAVFSKIVAHDVRTASQPTRRGQPGWTHCTCSPCDQTSSIRAISSVSNA